MPKRSPRCTQVSRARAPNRGWTHPTSPGGPQRRAWQCLRVTALSPKSPPPHGKPSSSSESQQPGCGRAPKAAQEFLPGARLPPKMPFPPGMRGAKGGLRPPAPSSHPPQPQLLPVPSTSPPPRLQPSPRLPAALMLPISCPEAPVLLPVFLTALAAPGALCGRVKGKRAGEAAPGWAGSPQLPEAAVRPPPPKKKNPLLAFPPLGFQLCFSSEPLQPSGLGDGAGFAWCHAPQLPGGSIDGLIFGPIDF